MGGRWPVPGALRVLRALGELGMLGALGVPGTYHLWELDVSEAGNEGLAQPRQLLQ